MPAGSAPAASEPGSPYRRLRFRITGASPLVMHNGRLANPLDPIAKEMRRISAKRAKTEADYLELARLEVLGGLYLSDGEPCLPGEVVEGALIEAARRIRRGPQARAGLVAEGNVALLYEGPRAPEALWADERFRLVAGVRVQKNRIMRTRPVFRDWAGEISLDFLPGVLNPAEVEEIVRVAGQVVGIGDWRPRFGRFTAARR